MSTTPESRRRAARVRQLLWWLAVVVVGAGVAFAYQHFILDAPPDAFRWVWEGRSYELLHPWTLGVALVAPALLVGLGVSLADLPWPQRVLSFLARMAFVVCLGLALGRLVRTTETKKVCTVAVVDVSDSVSAEGLALARKQLVELAAGTAKDDRFRVVTFARRPRLIELERKDGKLVVPSAEALRHQPDGAADAPPRAGASVQKGATATPAPSTSAAPGAGDDDAATEDRRKPLAGTDIQSALQLAYGVFPPGYLKRVVLITDGVETQGDVLAESNRARGFGVKLFTAPLRQRPPGEVALRELRVPGKVQIGQTFDIVANVYSSRKTTATARLYMGETLNGLDGVKQLELEPGPNEVKFKSVVRVGGSVTYALKLDDIEQDKFKENNGYAVTVDVPGRPAVLYVEGQPQRASYLSSALTSQQFDVDVRTPQAFPGSLKELERFAFVIVSDVPKERFSTSSQALLERYVRDLGGGFLFAGGEAGFGLGGWSNTTMERILPVRMDVERRKEMPGVAMVLVIDRSGSMTGLPMEMAKEACKATVSTLEGDDLIEIIAFDSSPHRFVKMQPARYRSRIRNQIARITPSGGTDIFRPLDMAYQDISVIQARKKHVILLTDGRASTQGIKDLAQAMVAESITVTTVGLGEGADVDLLRTIADTAGGRFHHVPDPGQLVKIFTRETELIARQAAVEEWFPVQQVAPADFLKGIAINSAPLLHGYVATQMKGPPARLILASDRGEPILASWRVGLGHSLAWTSDVKNLWAVDWLRWAGYGKFWGQLVRENMRKKQSRELDMKSEVIGGKVHAVVDAFSPDERFQNDLESELTVMGPAPSKDSVQVPLRQTAPGRYEADFPLERYGSFTLKAVHKRVTADGEEQVAGVSYGHVSHPYPREYASFEPDVERLERAASAGGGKVDPKASEVFDPAGEKIVAYEQLWPWFVVASFVFLLLDLLMRRVRIFDRKFVPSRRRSGPVSVRG